jgi:hypothetical protein
VQVEGVGVAKQHVARLHVAVYDARAMRVVERVGHLGAHLRSEARRHRAAGLEQPTQVTTADVLGGDVGAAVLHAVVVDVDHVW